jgi:hypothetical protein
MYSLVCLFPTILKTNKETSNNVKWVGNRIFYQIIFVDFCDNSMHRSWVRVLNYIMYKFYGCTIVFKESKIFEQKQQLKQFPRYARLVTNLLFFFRLKYSKWCISLRKSVLIFLFKILSFPYKLPCHYKIYVDGIVTKNKFCWLLIIWQQIRFPTKFDIF